MPRSYLQDNKKSSATWESNVKELVGWDPVMSDSITNLDIYKQK